MLKSELAIKGGRKNLRVGSRSGLLPPICFLEEAGKSDKKRKTKESRSNDESDSLLRTRPSGGPVRQWRASRSRSHRRVHPEI